MNKKITIYELMGLVKDGKASKTIKYEENIYKYLNRNYFYGYYTGEGLLYDLFDDKDVFRMLNDEVEILEEEKAEITEEQIESFKEQFNIVWNSIKSVLGGILEALQEIDKEESIKSVKKEINNIEKLNKNHFHKKQRQLANKINELIDVINELRGKDESRIN